MKYLFLAVIILQLGTALRVNAQELYVFTEPASNMPAKSLGLRLTNEGIFSGRTMNRTIPELMLSFNKNLMIHAQGFLSDMDGNYRLEGGSIYAKYRVLSRDNAQRHFRMAAYGRLSTSKRPLYTQDINLEGDNSGAQGGLVATQLLHKLALSANISYIKAFVQDDPVMAGVKRPDELIAYSLSSGYLVLPVHYKNYNQPNFNVYFEMLGKTNPANGKSYLDLAPAIQMILNSRTRVDLGYRFQAAGGMEGRYNKNMYLLRAEFNFFNALK
ncbi:MAG: hypothetical protein ABWY16_13920 [Pedobacter sp.]|uniref:hypothetical protein n=1 Tax=Pedobacter sp. TaxID=1411316 RepID=UPI003391B375